ncbi:MAG: hypothetical protein JSU94_02550, partial [Phycisphaerales bacterium]
MNRHPTEQELIDYQFELLSKTRAGQVDGHLAECARCREHLERLRRRFSGLDLLAEETKASGDLISGAIERAAMASKPRVVHFGWPAWAGAAAAVLVMGFLLAVSNSRKATLRPTVDILAQGPAGRTDARHTGEELKPPPDESRSAYLRAERESLSYKLDKDGGLGVDSDFAFRPEESSRRKTTSAPKDRPDFYASHERTVQETAGKPVARARPLRDIPEEPPFAPASAIELVTLPRRDRVQITIYNSADLTLVRERRNLTLKRGWNWLQFMWANTLIDPTSLSLEPLEQREKIDIEQLVFPARLRELGRWLIRSEVGGQVPFEITYLTSGLSWRAFYMGTLAEDEQKMDLTGYVRVANNSGEDYEDAQTRLIVGQVHLLDRIAELAKRQYPYGTPVTQKGVAMQWFDFDGDHLLDRKKEGLPAPDGYGYAGGYGGFGGMGIKEVKKEGLSEYFLYTIEGTETVPNQWGKRLQSFEANDIPVKSLYKYDEERWGNQTIRFVSFVNDAEHNLGDTPIPNGAVRIYGLADAEGYLSYVGGTGIKYIPVNEEVELNLGPARLVRMEPVLIDFKTENYEFDKEQNVAGWDEVRSWKMNITNTRPLAIEIEITRGFGTAYWTLGLQNNGIYYKKHDATHARFKLKLEPASKRTFRYTVTTFHGIRQEAQTQA